MAQSMFVYLSLLTLRPWREQVDKPAEAYKDHKIQYTSKGPNVYVFSWGWPGILSIHCR